MVTLPRARDGDGAEIPPCDPIRGTAPALPREEDGVPSMRRFCFCSLSLLPQGRQNRVECLLGQRLSMGSGSPPMGVCVCVWPAACEVLSTDTVAEDRRVSSESLG